MVVPTTVTDSGVPAYTGRVRLTEAVPFSSAVSLTTVLSTSKVPSRRPSRRTSTSSSLSETRPWEGVSSSEERSIASVSPAAYVDGAPSGKVTPTLRCE